MDTTKVAASKAIVVAVKAAITGETTATAKWKDAALLIASEMDDPEGWIKSDSCTEMIEKALPAEMQKALAHEKGAVPEGEKALRKEAQQRIGAYKAKLLKHLPKGDSAEGEKKAAPDHVAKAIAALAQADKSVRKAEGSFSEALAYIAMASALLNGLKPKAPEAPKAPETK